MNVYLKKFFFSFHVTFSYLISGGVYHGLEILDLSFNHWEMSSCTILRLTDMAGRKQRERRWMRSSKSTFSCRIHLLMNSKRKSEKDIYIYIYIVIRRQICFVLSELFSVARQARFLKLGYIYIYVCVCVCVCIIYIYIYIYIYVERERERERGEEKDTL